MIGLLGKKIGMTQLFDENGRQIPVTVMEVGPCSIMQVKTKETDGYQAVQLGFEEKKPARATQPEAGHAKKASVKPSRFVREIKTDSLEGLEAGKTLTVNNFAVHDWVDVIGTSKGRGFQGVVKRHGFKGGEKAHGSMFGRVPGSIGQSSYPSRVFKGIKMPGHMGHTRITTQNLFVEKIDAANHLLVVRGSVPGPNNGYVIICEALKKRRPRHWKLPEDKVDVLERPVKKMPAAKKGKTAQAVKKDAAAKKK